MTRWLTVMTALWVSSATAQLGGLLKDLTGKVTQEIAAVKDPLDKTAVFIGFSQCQNVKKIFGVSYDQYTEEPDLSHLTLDFISKDIQLKFNLSSIAKLASSPWFKPEAGIHIFLHGFTDDPNKESFSEVSSAFYDQDKFNIIALDASSLIRWLYLRSSTMVRFIGQTLGAALTVMIRAGLKPASIHLIGHSLGAHIASFTGKTVFELTGSRVGRISGLDPAGPCFADVEPALRLNRTDADFIDVIHTDAGVYGYNGNLGHVDYHPNSGSEQPNCLFQTCSHSRAWELYAESIKNKTGFPAISCDSWMHFKEGQCNKNNISLMGYYTKPGTTGQYYLQTAGESPFALGLAGINFRDNDAIVRDLRDLVGLWKR